jgi:hypothetical protein
MFRFAVSAYRALGRAALTAALASRPASPALSSPAFSSSALSSSALSSSALLSARPSFDGARR